MEGPPELDSKPPEDANALVFPDDLVDPTASVGNEGLQFVLPVDAAHDALHLELGEDLHKDLQQNFTRRIAVFLQFEFHLPELQTLLHQSRTYFPQLLCLHSVIGMLGNGYLL